MLLLRHAGIPCWDLLDCSGSSDKTDDVVVFISCISTTERYLSITSEAKVKAMNVLNKYVA